MKFSWFVVIVFLVLCYSCKKATKAATTSTTIVGKWQIASHTSSLYSLGVKLDTTTQTSFTTDDFIEYFNDGSGIFSAAASPSPSIVLFNYTIKGLNLVQISDNSSLPETITLLNANNLSYYFKLSFVDGNTGNTDNETDNYVFKR